MTNLEKYKNAFVEGLEIDAEGVENLVFEGIPEWDSVGHMSLIACIEEAFDIMISDNGYTDLAYELLLKKELSY